MATKPETIQTIRRRVAAKIARMTADRAKEVLAAIRAESPKNGATIFHETIREITGGYVSQSINFHVIRKLGEQAGFAARSRS